MDDKNIGLIEYFLEEHNLQVISYTEEEPQNVKSLNLSKSGISVIDEEMLRMTPNLQSIDFSHNLLTDLSNLKKVNLSELKKLDLKYNRITNFSFLSNFKSLEELDIRGNNFDSTLTYWTVSQLPRLKIFNEEDITEIRRYITMAELEVISSIDNILISHFAVSLQRTESAILQMKEKLTQTLIANCGIIEEAKFALKQKVEQLIDNKLIRIVENIIRKITSNENLLNNIEIKPNSSSIIASEVMPIKNELNDFKSDILSKAIAEAIGELNVEIFATICKPEEKVSQTSGIKRKNSESLKTMDKNMKPKPLVNQIITHKRSGSSFPLNYDLMKVLRKHSRKSDPNDSKTSIWDIKYRPIGRMYCGSHLVVSCGGHIVNIIDLKSGSVTKRYEDSNGCETFNCVVWRDLVVNTSNGKTRDLSLLCVGGTRKDKKQTNILFLNADDFNDYIKIGSHSKSVNCLLFNPIKKNLLFSGGYDKKVIVWGLDSGKMTQSSKLSSLTVRKLKEIDCNNRILNFTFAKNLNTLVVSGEDGIHLIKPSDNKCSETRVNSLLIYKVDIPEKKKVIDGLVMIGSDSNLVAFRLKDSIIIANLYQMMESAKSAICKGVVPLVIVNRLRYCSQKCDYFYMTIESRLLCCGSADGQIFLYYLKDSILKNQQKENLIEPILVLPKPQLNNICVKTESLTQKTDPLFVNIAAVSPNHEYIVGGTNNNLICIWKRSQTLFQASTNQMNKKLKTVSFI